MLKAILIFLYVCITYFPSQTCLAAPAESAPPAHRAHQTKPYVEPKPFVRGHYVLNTYMPANGYHKGHPVLIVVDKGSHYTHVLQLQNDRIVRVLSVSNSIGKFDTPTSPGRYKVSAKAMYPVWTPPKSIDPEQKQVPPYNETHRNPLGVASISLDKFEMALHGTNEPGLIRKSASHGCIRHSNADILRIYPMVQRGTVVYIVNSLRGKVVGLADFGMHQTSRRS